MNIGFCSVLKKNNNFFLNIYPVLSYFKLYPNNTKAPTPAGITIFKSQMSVTLIVSPKRLSVNGANNKSENCHLKPNSTSETVGKTDKQNNMMLIPVEI